MMKRKPLHLMAAPRGTTPIRVACGADLRGGGVLATRDRAAVTCKSCKAQPADWKGIENYNYVRTAL